MKTKVIPYGIFFILASLYAFYVSQSESKKLESGEEWETVPKGTISRIVYEAEVQKIIVQKDATLPRYWVEVNSVNQADQSAQVEKFLAQDSISEILDGFSPLRATKVLGKTESLKLEDFGIDKSNQTLTVEYGSGKSLSLRFGKRSFQSTEVFVLDTKKNSVFLLDKQFLTPLEKAKARLALLLPYQFKLDELRAITITQPSKTVEYISLQKGEVRQWAKADKKDVVDESFRNWLDKFLKLRVEGYPDENDLKSLEQAEVRVTLVVRGEKGKLDTLSLFEQKGENGSKYWIKAENLPVPVLLEASKVNLLLNDLSSL